MDGAGRARRRDRSGLIGIGTIWALLGAALWVTNIFPVFQQLGYFLFAVGAGIALTGLTLALRDRRRRTAHRDAERPDR